MAYRINTMSSKRRWLRSPFSSTISKMIKSYSFPNAATTKAVQVVTLTMKTIKVFAIISGYKKYG